MSGKPNSIAVATVATRSHIALSRTLLGSVAKRMPSAARFLLLVDSIEATTPAHIEGATILHPSEIVTASEFRSLTSRYTAPEVCFALKPRILLHLLTLGFEQVHYLDSDAWLIGPLDEAVELLRSSSALLTPHLYARRTLGTSHATSDLDLLMAGTFNAGYVAVSQRPEASKFLHWWGDRTYRWGYNLPLLGMCGDQRWLDLVPRIFEGIEIWRIPGLNAGYWNLGGVHIEREGDMVFVDGHALLMLHLSGFDPQQPHRMSRFVNHVVLEAEPVLAGILREYAETLLHNGYREDRHAEYAHRSWLHGSSLPVRTLRALSVLYRLKRARKSERSHTNAT